MESQQTETYRLHLRSGSDSFDSDDRAGFEMENVANPPIGKSMKHKTMALAAADALRSQIMRGVYSPGQQLRQDTLAAEFGMSRIPIREALFLIEREGLIKILPHRGAVVVRLSPEEVEEVFNMRALLEPFLLERSAPKLTAADFRMLAKIQSRYVDAIRRADVGSWNEVNSEFHLELYKHAESPRMIRIVQNLLTECDRLTRVQLLSIEGDQARAVREHAELLRLCETQQFAAACVLLGEHIQHIRAGLVAVARAALPAGARG
jgi:DNA-binding GntR family transcriptional regulator